MKKQYDFWYSEKQKERIKTSSFSSFKQVLIDGKRYEYTEAVESGKKHSSVWDDFIFVGTATDADTVVKAR